MPITFFPAGGLGNQLFQYGIALANSQRLGVSLFANLELLKLDAKRTYELDSFSNSVTIQQGDEALAPAQPRRRLRIKAPRRLLVRETNHLFDPNLLNLEDASHLLGYFQSWKYLLTVEETLRTQLQKPLIESHWFRETRSLLRGLKNWTALHYRADDYRDISELGVLEPAYYERSLRLIEANAESGGQVVIFCQHEEDGIWLAREISATNPLILSERSESRPLEALLLMSEAPNLVLANSSLSWWSGWLGHNRKGLTIAPAPWFKSYAFSSRDLVYPSWIQISQETKEAFTTKSSRDSDAFLRL